MLLAYFTVTCVLPKYARVNLLKVTVQDVVLLLQEENYNMGNAYKNLTEYQQAIIAYKKAIEIKPDYSDAYYNMGDVYNILKEFQQAISAYKKAIEIEPELINHSKTTNWDAIKAWINTQPEKQEYLEIIAKLEGL